MDNASEGALRRRHGEPAYAGYQAGPKRERSQVMRPHSRMTPTQMRPGVKHRPTVTPNGHTEQGNPLAALGGGRYTEQVTSRKPQVGEIAQEAKAWGNAQDTLTWARTMGR